MADYKLLIEALKQYHDSKFTPKVYEHSIFGVAALTIEKFAKDTNVLTNADHIRVMTDEELAKFICKHTDCGVCKFDSLWGCKLQEWLKQPYKEGETDV
jgi:hypothetical protein